MRRRSYLIKGADGLVAIEALQQEDGTIEVAELDERGEVTGPITQAKDWPAVREYVAVMVAGAVKEQRV